MKLRFKRYRQLFEHEVWEPHVEKQVGALLSSPKYDRKDVEESWGRLELVDVVDAKSGETRYQLYLYPSGSGRVFEHGTTKAVGYVAQHGLEVDDIELFDALEAAFEGADYFEESVYFN